MGALSYVINFLQEPHEGKKFHPGMLSFYSLYLVTSIGWCQSQLLLNAASESEVLTMLEAHQLASITGRDIEELINRNYFSAAGEIIKRSHDEGIDFSASVRQSISSIRTRLDHLVKLLDPEFSRPQKVSPAFQWTQNDSSIFILLKYSRRFNAPGAIDVSDFNCTFTNTSLYFSAVGGHSGKRFEYALVLDFFDYIDPEKSSWSVGSVGKVSLTIPKRMISRWPRLLSGTEKIDNMHYWMDYGEKMEQVLKFLPEVRYSGRVCSSSEQVYCLYRDKCLDSCVDCKGKLSVSEQLNSCVGPPINGPREAKFVQLDSSRKSIGGRVEVSLKKEHHKYDITGFEVLLDEKLVAQSSNVSNLTLIEVPSTSVAESDQVPLLIVPTNAFGRSIEKAFRMNITNEFVPTECSRIERFEFEDNESVTENHLKGWFRYSVPADADGAKQLTFHFGQNEEERISKGKSLIGETNVSVGLLNITSAVTIPGGASHVLVFPKNAMGESDRPVGVWRIDIRRRPRGVVQGLELTADKKVRFNKFESETGLTGYTVRAEWPGKRGKGTVVKEIEFVPVSGAWTFSSAITGEKAVEIPESKSANLCVYLTNEAGTARSGSCVPLKETARSEL